MPTPSATIWKIEDHTVAKHLILQKYLGAWFPILGSASGRVVYIDGFCGPGVYQGGERGSPLVVLELLCGADSKIDRKCQEIVCLFTDDRQDRLQSLSTEISRLSLPGRVTPYVIKGTFESQLQAILDRLDAHHVPIAPTFAFVDPFGHKGVPFGLLERFLRRERTEALINFNVQSSSRFLDANPDNKKHLEAMLGRPFSFTQITQGRRHEELRDAYKEQLLKIADYVFYFHVADSSNRPIYDLFFVTKHKKGVEKMKDAFWKADPRYGVSFSDATDPRHPVLLDEASYNAELLGESIHRQFSGCTASCEDVADFVLIKTPYRAPHKTNALRLLKSQGKVTAHKDGKPYNRGFPDDALLTFTQL